jgi:hypothetical protein
MRHRLSSRGLSALLAAALLGVAGGASDLDAFRFHSPGRPAAAEAPHVETAGNPACHADRCVLALVLAGRAVVTTARPPERAADAPRCIALAPAGAPPRSRPPGLHQHPRAPPPPSA